MVENLKIGLRIFVSLPVLVLLLAIVIAVGVPALIGYLIQMGAYFLSKNTIGKLSLKVRANPFFELLYILILTPIMAIGILFYVPAVIAALPLFAYFSIMDYLAGRYLEKIGYQIA